MHLFSQKWLGGESPHAESPDHLGYHGHHGYLGYDLPSTMKSSLRQAPDTSSSYVINPTQLWRQ
jgi:hypothetical protein